jgi:microcystin degradation protein MlrC
MARIAVGGFQHETNTFAPELATFEDFQKHDGWPGLVRGQGLFDAVAGINLPIAGFIEAARRDRHDLMALTWCSAEPCSYVERLAFERICDQLCGDLGDLGPLDGVYLDLHGAMVTEHLEDGEGEILRRVREAVGPRTPLVASLDFHANITRAMVEEATALTVYRTYPHIDMAETGVRAYSLLARVLTGEILYKAFRKLPFLIPLTAQCTYFEPSRSIFEQLGRLQGTAAASIDFAEGFPPADILECGPAILAYDADPERAESAADAVTQAALAAEATFENPLVTPDAAAKLAVANCAGKPIILADVQDNPGAGASSDSVGILEALLRHGAKGAVIAILNDPEMTSKAHAAGVGGTIDGELGGKSAQPGQRPYRGAFRVEALGDGRVTCSGEMMRGAKTNLGPMALIRVVDEASEVRVIIGGHRFQCLDQAFFRHLGVDPGAQRILVIKSTVHFRADFDALAERTLAVEAPGAHPCRLTEVDYRRLREGVRLEPGGPPFRRKQVV